MRVWRISRQAFVALDGEGARLDGRRRNSEGIAVVYTPSTLPLAALEYLPHIDIEDVPGDLRALAIEIPDDAPAEEVDPASLPSDWNRVQADRACAALGDDWARRGAALG